MAAGINASAGDVASAASNLAKSAQASLTGVDLNGSLGRSGASEPTMQVIVNPAPGMDEVTIGRVAAGEANSLLKGGAQ